MSKPASDMRMLATDDSLTELFNLFFFDGEESAKEKQLWEIRHVWKLSDGGRDRSFL